MPTYMPKGLNTRLKAAGRETYVLQQTEDEYGQHFHVIRDRKLRTGARAA